MAYIFENLLKKRNLSLSKVEDFNPIWKLKISEEEFNELKRELKYRILYRREDLKYNYAKECFLYYSLYWQRIYNGGTYSKETVMISLIGDEEYQKNVSKKLEKLFFETATIGIQELGIRIIDENRNEPFYTLLYQGGLPLSYISNSTGTWFKFTKDLVTGKIDLSNPELNLPKLAENYNPLKDFGWKLYEALVAKEISMLPFWCESYTDQTYSYLQTLRSEEITRLKESSPISFLKFIDLNEDNGNFRPLIKITTPYKLEEEENSVDGTVNKHLNIQLNGLTIDYCDYKNGYCFSPIKNIYVLESIEDSIVVKIDEVPIDSFNYFSDIPELLFFTGRENNYDRYSENGTFGNSQMLLLIPQGWKIESELPSIIKETKTKNNDILKYIILPPNYSEEICLKNESETIIFGKNNKKIITNVAYRAAYLDFVKYPLLWNGDTLTGFSLEEGKEGEFIKNRRQLKFSYPYSNDWSVNPGIGKILTRAVSSSNEFIKPTTIFNVGKDFSIEVIETNNNSCKLRIAWKDGTATCIESEAILDSNDNSWNIKKTSLKNPNEISFRLAPKVGKNNSFVIKIRAPFCQYEILDEFGETVKNDAYIPLCDYPRYIYNIYGYERMYLNVGSIRFSLHEYETFLRLRYSEDIYWYLNREIKKDGNLPALYGNPSFIEDLLHKRSVDIVHNKLNLSIRPDLTERGRINLYVKEYPYRLNYDESNYTFSLYNPDIQKTERNFKHGLLVFRLYNPLDPPVKIETNEEKVMILPEILRSEYDLLVAGDKPGRVLPTLINKGIYNQRSKSKITEVIKEELDILPMQTEPWVDVANWFRVVSEYGIHPTSLVQLEVAASTPENILKWIFWVSVTSELGDDLIRISANIFNIGNQLNVNWANLIYKDLPLIFQSYINLNDPELRKYLIKSTLAGLPDDVIVTLTSNEQLVITSLVKIIERMDLILERVSQMSNTI